MTIDAHVSLDEKRKALRKRKITIKSAPAPSPLRGETIDTDLPRQDLGTYQEDGRNAKGSISQVVRLIHLNGPPGIGKSTTASAFAARHPGVLNLDIDRAKRRIFTRRLLTDSDRRGTRII